jgi:hypothetical protein
MLNHENTITRLKKHSTQPVKGTANINSLKDAYERVNTAFQDPAMNRFLKEQQVRIIERMNGPAFYRGRHLESAQRVSGN